MSKRSRVEEQQLIADAPQGSGSWLDREHQFQTLEVHSGVHPDPVTGAILTPIYQATTFVQKSIEKYCAKGFSYSRSSNPTVAALEAKLCALENGKGCKLFSTGMAATCTAVSTFCSAGDHAIITDCSYGGTNRACRVYFTKLGISFSFVDMTDSSFTDVKAAIQPNTKMILSESPANPTCRLIDISALSALCKEKNIIHVCDNTFATPVIFRPLDHGADVTLVSTTKFVDGHNITVGGALVVQDLKLLEKLQLTQNILGNNMSPQVAFYQLQTVKTLSMRIARQSATALKIAEFLQTHKKVDKVMYPGLKNHPQHAIALKQHRNGLHGGMLWFEVQGGTSAGRQLMNSVPKPWSLCENLGATESIITCPAVMTHANMQKEDRLKVGITDGFIRVSCGIEDADDLIKALASALDAL